MDRRDNPKDDLMSLLWRIEVDRNRTTMDDMDNYGVLLFVAGLDTVMQGMGHGVRYLAGDVASQQRLRRKPELIPEAVEEILRRYAFTVPMRRVTKDATFQGVQLKANDRVMLYCRRRISTLANFRIGILSSKVLSTWGGNTEFCNTYAAWDLLQEEEKKQLESLRVMHSAWTSLFYYEPEPSYAKLQEMIELGEVELPLVWKHRSGRESLILGCTAHHVVGMNPTESTKLLVRLRDWATQPRFVYSHKWSVGDAVMWDNTGTMHRAMPYDPNCGRLLHRTKTAGEEPIA